MNARKKLNLIRSRRTKRVRAGIRAVAKFPRLSVFRSNKAFYAQLINDSEGKTLVAVSMKEIKDAKLTKTQAAEKLGALMAEKAKSKGIAKAVFDRGRYPFHGRVKAFAEAARGAGLSI